MDELTMTETVDPGWAWEGFAQAVGYQELEACYGWDAPPGHLRWGESAYLFYLGTPGPADNLVGWASLTRMPKEPGWFELGLGVWPKHRGRGYRHQILRACANRAFEGLGAEHVSMLVFDGTAHAAQCLREAEVGSAWVYAGRIWYPVPYRVFTISREAWDTRKSSPKNPVDAMCAVLTSRQGIKWGEPWKP